MPRLRKSAADNPETIRIAQTVKTKFNPGIAELYAKNSQDFHLIVCDAIELYAYLLKKTGARTLIEVMDSIGVGMTKRDDDLPAESGSRAAKPFDAVQKIDRPSASSVTMQSELSRDAAMAMLNAASEM